MVKRVKGAHLCGSQHSTQCLEQVPSFISAFPKHLNPLGQGEGSCSLSLRLQNSATSTLGDVLHPWDSLHRGGQSLRTSGPWLEEDKQGDPPAPLHLLGATYSAQVLGGERGEGNKATGNRTQVEGCSGTCVQGPHEVPTVQSQRASNLDGTPRI